MNNVVTINHARENVLEFSLALEGVENQELNVVFFIETQDVNLCFVATKKDKDVWIVKIPKLPFLKQTSYPFYIQVLVDGYHFEPMDGTVSVIGSTEVYSSEPKNITLEPSAKSSKPKIPQKEVKIEPIEKLEPSKTTETPTIDEKPKTENSDKKDNKTVKQTTADTKTDEKKSDDNKPKITGKSSKKPTTVKEDTSLLKKEWKRIPKIKDQLVHDIAQKLIQENDKLIKKPKESTKFNNTSSIFKKPLINEDAATDKSTGLEEIVISKDKQVLDILEQCGIAPKKKKTKKFKFDIKRTTLKSN